MQSTASTQELELALMLALTRRLPRIRGAGVIANRLRRIFNRKPRRLIDADVLGFAMRVDPREMVDGVLLFCPQLYDHREVAFLKSHLAPGDVFLDIGSNIGFYSLVASSLVGADGRVLAFEADPYNHAQMLTNLGLNDINNVLALNVGVSDKHETLRLGVNNEGNRGENSFLLSSTEGVAVPCCPLSHALHEHGITHVKAAKLDIEGFEFRVLTQFFADVRADGWPQFIIVEDNPVWTSRADGDAMALLRDHGYRPKRLSKLNYVMVR